MASRFLTYDQAKMAIEMTGLQFRWNLRSMQMECSSVVSSQDDWGPVNLRGIKLKIQADSGKPIGIRRLRGILNAIVYTAQVDPFIEWLESLPPWDGEKRVDSRLTDIFGVHGPLHEWASRYPLIGAIQRAYEPGCKLDEFPVLIGPSDLPKRIWIHNLFPHPLCDRWITPDVRLGQYSRWRAIAPAVGKVIASVSISSISSRLSEEGAERMHNLISQQKELVPPWARIRNGWGLDKRDVPRRFIFVGTAALDREGALPTANRRFVPVNLLEQRKPVTPEPGELKQLWAEALAAYRSGARANLPQALWKMARKAALHESREYLSGAVSQLL